MNLTHFKRRVTTFSTRLGHFAVWVAASSSLAWADPALPNIKILATGGTIAGAGVSSTQYAGYQAAVTPVDKLLLAVPELGKVANVTGEQISQVASHNMSNEILLKLAKRVNVLLASPEVDGVVITHGTNTLEESAYFLNLVIKSEKPVVMVGAMRPGTSMSADGPMNIFRSVITAGSKDARGRGVMVVMNDQIIGARDLQKTDTMTVDTFKAPVFGYLGFVVDSKTHFYKPPARKHTYQAEFDVSKISALPKVDIVMGYEDDSRAAVDAFVSLGRKELCTRAQEQPLSANRCNQVFRTLSKRASQSCVHRAPPLALSPETWNSMTTSSAPFPVTRFHRQRHGCC